MKPSLQLRISQQLTMTPQLQQAIRLLQLSTLELQQEIQEALDANPLLEMDDDHDSGDSSNSGELSDSGISNAELARSTGDSSGDHDGDFGSDFDSSDNHSDHDSTLETGDALNRDQINDDLPMDMSWDEMVSAPGKSSSGEDNDQIYQGETSQSLQDYLLWQMRLTPFSETDLAIATTIIDAVDESGFLTIDVADILLALGNDEIEADEVEAVLKRIQLFDPIGVASRSLQECLLVQLRQFAADTPFLAEARMVLAEHIDLLGSRDYRTLMRKTRLSEDDLREVLRLIQALNPRPGSNVTASDESYVVPDVAVYKKNGKWRVELNPDAMPKVRINQQYAAMSRSARNRSDAQFIRNHLQEAKWFLKSLESRNETLLKVSSCIVEFQRDFFEYGDEAMKPMVLNDVAQAVEMHESTISRVTTQKYMHTPRGIFELKYFFSSHVNTESGGECSSTAIRAFIKKLVAAENPAKPLSDNQIADMLAEQGIQVARRTIAKYREALAIPPSNQRKSLL